MQHKTTFYDHHKLTFQERSGIVRQKKSNVVSTPTLVVDCDQHNKVVIREARSLLTTKVGVKLKKMKTREVMEYIQKKKESLMLVTPPTWPYLSLSRMSFFKEFFSTVLIYH